MSKTSDGTRGEPQFASTGNAPTFAADLTLLSSFFAARADRAFTTVALLAAATGSGIGEWARAANAPGARYWFNTSTNHWQLGNRPIVANQSARDNLYSGTLAPVAGDEVFRADLGLSQMYNGSAWKFKGSGLIPIIPGPPTPGGTGSSASVGVDGAIAFAACTSLIIPNIFSVDFDNVDVELNVPIASANLGMNVQLGTGGSADSTANYDNQSLAGTSSSSSGGQALAGTSWTITPGSSGQNKIFDLELHFKAANLAQPTRMIELGGASLNPMTTNAAVGMKYLTHRLSNQYTDMIITFTSGAGTGALRAYGRNNN